MSLKRFIPMGLLALNMSVVHAGFWDFEDDDELDSAVVSAGVGRIAIDRPLAEDRWYGCSYSSIRADLARLSANPAVRCIVLDIDSPGGCIVGLRETVEAIRQARETKHVVAYVRNAASAAYWLAAACERIFAADTACAGCVGAIIAFADATKVYEDMGVVFYRFTSQRTENKAPAPGTPAFTVELQRRVDAAGDVFLADLGTMRKVGGDLGAYYQLGAFLPAADALSAGWIDEVVPVNSTAHRWLTLGGVPPPFTYTLPPAPRPATGARTPGRITGGSPMATKLFAALAAFAAMGVEAADSGEERIVLTPEAAIALTERVTKAETEARRAIEAANSHEKAAADALAQVKTRDEADRVRTRDDLINAACKAGKFGTGDIAAWQKDGDTLGNERLAETLARLAVVHNVARAKGHGGESDDETQAERTERENAAAAKIVRETGIGMAEALDKVRGVK